jgi:hypothetical protein
MLVRRPAKEQALPCKTIPKHISDILHSRRGNNLISLIGLDRVSSSLISRLSSAGHLHFTAGHVHIGCSRHTGLLCHSATQPLSTFTSQNRTNPHQSMHDNACVTTYLAHKWITVAPQKLVMRSSHSLCNAIQLLFTCHRGTPSALFHCNCFAESLWKPATST